MTVQRLRDKQARGEPITIEDFVLDAIITGAQPKAGTGHKMHFFQRYIVRDISLT